MYKITKITRGTTAGPDTKTWSSKKIINDRSKRLASLGKQGELQGATVKIEEIDAHIESLNIDTINFNLEALDTIDKINDTPDNLGESINYDKFEEIEKIEKVDFFDLFTPDTNTTSQVMSEAIMFGLTDQDHDNDDTSEDSRYELIETPNITAEKCYNNLKYSFYDNEIIIWAQDENNHQLIIVASDYFGESLIQSKLQTVTIGSLGLSVLVIDPEQKHWYFPNSSDDKKDKTTLTPYSASIKRQQLKATTLNTLDQNDHLSRKRLKKNNNAEGVEKKRARFSPVTAADPTIDPSYVASSSSAPQPTSKQKDVSIPACAGLNHSGIVNDRSLIQAKEGDCYCSNCDQFTEKEPLVTAHEHALYQCSECKQHYAYARNPIELQYIARLCRECLEHAENKGCISNNNQPFIFIPDCAKCTQPAKVFTSESETKSTRISFYRPVIRDEINQNSGLSPTFLDGVNRMLPLVTPKKSGTFYPKCFYCKSHIFYQSKPKYDSKKYRMERYECRACKSEQTSMYSKDRYNVNPTVMQRYDFELSLCMLCDKMTSKVIIKNSDKSIKGLICTFCNKKYPYPGYKLVIKSASAKCKICDKLIPYHMGRFLRYEGSHKVCSYYCDQCQSYSQSSIMDNKHVISHIGYLSHYNQKNNSLPQSLKKAIDKGVTIPVEKQKYRSFLHPICEKCRTSLFMLVDTHFAKSKFNDCTFQCTSCKKITKKLSQLDIKNSQMKPS